MEKNRLEAFSDGVLAIIITIMVLELKVPHSAELEALAELWPVFFSYMLSFLYVGIYWNNHHHMFQITSRVTGGVLWANLFLLFWLSLLPFTTGWVGENHFARWPTVIYGVNLLLCGLAFNILATVLSKAQGAKSLLAQARGADVKGNISWILYIVGILVAWFFPPQLAMVIFFGVAMMWLVPDRRIERLFDENTEKP